MSTWGEEDAARTAVLVHGITGSAASWVRVGPALAARGFRVIAVDLRGHAGSPWDDRADCSLYALAADLADTVPREPDVLVGHSFGGTLSVTAVRSGWLAPRRLVLEDPVLHFADADTPAALLAHDEATLPRNVAGTLARNPRWHESDARGKADSLDGLDWGRMRRMFAANAPWDLRGEVAALGDSLPVLVLLPPDSFYVPGTDKAALRDALGAEAVVTMPGTGHSIHRDDMDAFLAAIDALPARTG